MFPILLPLAYNIRIFQPKENDLGTPRAPAWLIAYTQGALEMSGLVKGTKGLHVCRKLVPPLAHSLNVQSSPASCAKRTDTRRAASAGSAATLGAEGARSRCSVKFPLRIRVDRKRQVVEGETDEARQRSRWPRKGCPTLGRGLSAT